MFTPLQTIEGPDRIFHPQMISYVDARVLPTVVTFFGGSTMEIDNTTDSNQLYESLKASGAFIEHDHCLYNPADVAQVVFHRNVEYPSSVTLRFASGDNRFIIMEVSADKFYQKWIDFSRLVNVALEQMMQPRQIITPAHNGFDPANISRRRN